MHLDEFFDYKNQLMKDLCSNEEVVKLITDRQDASVPDTSLAYSQIYPYEFVPETIDNGQTILCFDVDILRVDNKTYYTPVVYIWVFTHKSKLRLPSGGVRTDMLASKIDAMLNGSRFYSLGTLDLDSVERFVPITDYQGRVLIYVGRDFNRSGSKQPPTNRRILN